MIPDEEVYDDSTDSSDSRIHLVSRFHGDHLALHPTGPEMHLDLRRRISSKIPPGFQWAVSQIQPNRGV